MTRFRIENDLEIGEQSPIAYTPEEEAAADAASAAELLALAPTAADVKAECRRRILLIMTEDQQRNTLAAGQAAMMEFGFDPSAWPADLQARQANAVVAWKEIGRLRARSNKIEAMEPFPLNVTTDDLWSDE